jgi:ubiquinone/menaquinone biosynthesis C-methylase UbiE
VTDSSPEHWERRYQTAGATGVPWYQEHAATSIALMDAVGRMPEWAVLDVGGGASRLVDDLLASGQRDVTVLDVSATALNLARGRLDDPPEVTWIAADLLTWRPDRQRDLWHDRAVLHFLVDEAERATYVAQLRRAVRTGGAFVIGTFAEDGPTRCSGLPVRRYAASDLVDLLGEVTVTETRQDVHSTPAGAAQPFTWVAGRLAP